jgi:hypothetical protein
MKFCQCGYKNDKGFINSLTKASGNTDDAFLDRKSLVKTAACESYYVKKSY